MHKHLEELEKFDRDLAERIYVFNNARLHHKKLSSKIALERSIGNLKAYLAKDAELFDLYSKGRGLYAYEGADHNAIKFDLSFLIGLISAS